jgi:hypothetical protein
MVRTSYISKRDDVDVHFVLDQHKQYIIDNIQNEDSHIGVILSMHTLSTVNRGFDPVRSNQRLVKLIFPASPQITHL